MKKCDQIMALHAKGMSTREIALEVYGEATDAATGYVRVVRQRATPEGRKRTRVWQNAYYHNNPVRNAAVKQAIKAYWARKALHKSSNQIRGNAI